MWSSLAPAQFWSIATDDSSNDALNGTVVLHGKYFPNATFSGVPGFERDEIVDINWQGSSADSVILGTENFSVRWTGTFSVATEGDYEVVHQSSGFGLPMWVDGVPVGGNPGDQDANASPSSSAIHLAAGAHAIRIDFVAGGYPYVHWILCPAGGAQSPSWWSVEPNDYHASWPTVLSADPVVSSTTATLGQLRAVIALFRQRLTSLGYQNFPADVEGDDSDPVTLGDMQALFDFDPDEVVNNQGLTFAQVVDAGGNPADWYAGQPHFFSTIAGGAQTGPPGYFLEDPWTVKVTDGNGHFLVGAPVTFWLADNESGYLSETGDDSSPLVRKITVRTDEHGLAWVYIKL